LKTRIGNLCFQIKNIESTVRVKPLSCHFPHGTYFGNFLVKDNENVLTKGKKMSQNWGKKERQEGLQFPDLTNLNAILQKFVDTCQ